VFRIGGEHLKEKVLEFYELVMVGLRSEKFSFEALVFTQLQDHLWPPALWVFHLFVAVKVGLGGGLHLSAGLRDSPAKITPKGLYGGLIAVGLLGSKPEELFEIAGRKFRKVAEVYIRSEKQIADGDLGGSHSLTTPAKSEAAGL